MKITEKAQIAVVTALLNKGTSLYKIKSRFPELYISFYNTEEEGLRFISMNGMSNIVTINGKLLSNQWFDGIGAPHGKYIHVCVKKKWNILTIDGKILSEQWFDTIGSIRNGFFVVQLDGQCNFLSNEGKLLSEQWFDGAWTFDTEYKCARVMLNDKFNFINREGKLILPLWTYEWHYPQNV